MAASIIHQNRNKSFLKSDNLQPEMQEEQVYQSEILLKQNQKNFEGKLPNYELMDLKNEQELLIDNLKITRTLLRHNLKASNDSLGNLLDQMNENLQKLNRTTDLLYLLFFNVPILLLLQIVSMQFFEQRVANPQGFITFINLMIAAFLGLKMLAIFNKDPTTPEKIKKKLQSPKFYDYLMKKFSKKELESHMNFKEMIELQTKNLDENYQNYLKINFNQKLFDIKNIGQSYRYMKKYEKINSRKEKLKESHPFYYSENLHHIINKHLAIERV